MCDFDKIITYFQVGWPGSVYDSTVFAETRLFQKPQLYFSGNEFLLGDSGYTASLRMLTPFRNPQAQIEENAEFNVIFSSARVVVEHVMGLLKSRWSFLRGIRTQFRAKQDLEDINSQIVCAVVLHNIARLRNDRWTHPLSCEDLIETDYSAALENVSDGTSIREQIKRIVLNK